MPYAIVRMQFGNYSGERMSWIQVHKDGSLVKRDETYSAGESEYTSQIPTVLNELETGGGGNRGQTLWVPGCKYTWGDFGG